MMPRIALKVTGGDATLSLHEQGGASLRVSSDCVGKAPPIYEGPYSVTPSQHQQVLSTAGMELAHDVTVAPIPSNYGLITWNGSALTVS